MNRFAILLIFICSLTTSINARNKNLPMPFSWTKGDFAAYFVSEGVRLECDDLRAKKNNLQQVPSILVFYDRKKEIIKFHIYGLKVRPKEAKKIINIWIKSIESIYIPELVKRYDIEIKKEDFILTYNDRETEKEILRWHDGKYLLIKIESYRASM